MPDDKGLSVALLAGCQIAADRVCYEPYIFKCEIIGNDRPPTRCSEAYGHITDFNFADPLVFKRPYKNGGQLLCPYLIEVLSFEPKPAEVVENLTQY